MAEAGHLSHCEVKLLGQVLPVVAQLVDMFHHLVPFLATTTISRIGKTPRNSYILVASTFNICRGKIIMVGRQTKHPR